MRGRRVLSNPLILRQTVGPSCSEGFFRLLQGKVQKCVLLEIKLKEAGEEALGGWCWQSTHKALSSIPSTA